MIGHFCLVGNSRGLRLADVAELPFTKMALWRNSHRHIYGSRKAARRLSSAAQFLLARPGLENCLE